LKKQTNKTYDLIVAGSGPSGIMSAITAAKAGKKVLLLEKLPQTSLKLKATGGGKCNLSNTLSNEDFINQFGKRGKFMQDAIKEFDAKKLVDFFKNIGVCTHAPDGFRIFPTSHSSTTVTKALQDEMKRLDIDIKCNQKTVQITTKNLTTTGIKTTTDSFYADKIILATGGLGYPSLGGETSGYEIAKKLGHTIIQPYPAMVPLHTKETWVKNCTADTIPKAEIKINIKKSKNLKKTGDLIFTKNGIRGPVVLDFAREITPLLEKYNEVGILVNLTKGMDEDKITKHLKKEMTKNPHAKIIHLITTLLPHAISKELCNLANINPHAKAKEELKGIKKAKLITLLASTPLSITGHDGFEKAMITRGGIDLKEINPKTMQSKLIDGLYFCGEIVDLDGPCGGYNLQWSFASGYLAGKSL